MTEAADDRRRARRGHPGHAGTCRRSTVSSHVTAAGVTAARDLEDQYQPVRPPCPVLNSHTGGGGGHRGSHGHRRPLPLRPSVCRPPFVSASICRCTRWGCLLLSPSLGDDVRAREVGWWWELMDSPVFASSRVAAAG